jgi:hypothetical protein
MTVVAASNSQLSVPVIAAFAGVALLGGIALAVRESKSL